jgi:uncharacterized C2H2 Zn-finger protein
MADLCPVCEATFASAADLMAHVKKDHPDARPEETLSMNPSAHTPGLQCALCGKTFASRQQLAAHALAPHEDSWWTGEPAHA